MEQSTRLTWAVWAKNVRENNKLSAEQLAKKTEKDKETKLSIPILRAREESKHLMLSKLDLRSDDEKLEAGNRKTEITARTKSRNFSVYLDENEDTSFLENQMFVMSRTWGTTFTIVALVFNVYVLISPYWFSMGDRYHPTNAGLLMICGSHNDSCIQLYSHWMDIPNWTKLLIGFICLSSLTGLCGLIVAILGCIHKPIHKQMYYYHSSGEFSVIAFAMIMVGLLIFFISDRRTLKFNSFGLSFWMCLACGFLYFLAFILLTVDEIYSRIEAYLVKFH